MASEQDSTYNHSAPEGWTKREKFILLQSLKMHSSHNLEEILLSLPTKTTEEVQSAIAYYKQKALSRPRISTKNKKPKTDRYAKSRIPLNTWAKLLSDKFNFKDLETETATALRIIAEFETIPPAMQTEDIDFRQVYHLLANALEGKSLDEDKRLAAVIEKCLLETAIISKSFIRKCTLTNIMENINLQGEVNIVPRPTHIDVGSLIRHLASQKAYNPLNISDAYLKASK